MTINGTTTTVTSFKYDANNHRISKTTDDVTTTQIWNGDNIICDDVGGSNPSITTYVQGMDTEGMMTGNNFYANVYNGRGDVVQSRQVGGSASESYQYDAYGVNKSTATYTIPNPYRYSGEYTDSETGKVYLRARYYDPTTGRFTQQDTYLGSDSEPFTLNLYTYCGNNPVMYSDPSGFSKTYVIYYNNPSSGFKTQAMNSPYYDIKSKNVFMISVIYRQDFINAWNSMSGDIDYVYLYIHGGPASLFFLGPKEILNFSTNPSFSILQSKTVKGRVFLFSCEGGKGNAGKNVAWMFAKLTGTRVIACVGGVSYLNWFGKYYARSSTDPFGIWQTYYYEKNVAKSIPGSIW